MHKSSSFQSAALECEKVDALFDEMHKLVDGDLDLLATCMMPTLGNLTVACSEFLLHGLLQDIIPQHFAHSQESTSWASVVARCIYCHIGRAFRFQLALPW